MRRSCACSVRVTQGIPRAITVPGFAPRAEPGFDPLQYPSSTRVEPMTWVPGPADWAHGIFRPLANVVADPNPNLTVQLLCAPRGPWIGIEPQTHWQPDSGGGIGGGLIRDCAGVIGRVSMSVALTAFPGPARLP
jgi:hypothetical protein